MLPNSPVMLIGLDACDKDLAQKWADEGLLPNFARLFREGLLGDTCQAPGFESASALPDIYYGAWAGDHGQYDALRYFNPQSYQFEYYKREQLPDDYVWTKLAKQGKRCFVFDTPYSYLPDHPNCTAIFNWGQHVQSPDCDRIEPVTQPAELRDEVVAKFGTDPLGGVTCDFLRPRTADDLVFFKNALVERAHKRAEIASYYWNKSPWDFFFVMFSEAHCAGHHGWQTHDPNHDEHDPAVVAQTGDVVKEVYVAIDKAVGRLLDQLGDEAVGIVLFTHGMEQGYSGTRFMDRILAGLEETQPIAAMRDAAVAKARKLWHLGWEASPKPVKDLLNPIRRKARSGALYNQGFLSNRENRRFFEVYVNERNAGVRVNLAGRECHGMVQQGAEYEELCNFLQKELEKVTILGSGEPAFLKVMQVHQNYRGPVLDRLPDLIATWNRASRLKTVCSPTIGKVSHNFQSARTGDHRPFGMFAATGGGIVRGRLNADVQIIDMAPTIAAMLGVSPSNYSGDVIPGLVGSDALKARAI